MPVGRTAGALRRRCARCPRTGRCRHAHSRLSQLPGGARTTARGDVEQRSTRRSSSRTRRRGPPGATLHRDPGRSCAIVITAAMVSVRHVSSRRRGSCFAGRIAAGSSYLFLTRNAPELPSRVTTGDEVTRSLSVRLRGPIGEQTELPRRFEWLAVDRAVRYRVRLMAVDRQELWSTSTSALGVDLPSPVRASIAPGRTLLWDVTAYDAAGGLNCRIGDAIVQGRAKVITMLRIKAVGCSHAPACARDERGERARRRPDVPLSGRDGARGWHRSDETGGHGRHADLGRPSLFRFRRCNVRRRHRHRGVRPDRRSGRRRRDRRQPM